MSLAGTTFFHVFIITNNLFILTTTKNITVEKIKKPKKNYKNICFI